MGSTTPARELVHAQLARINASPEFRRAPKLREFLSFIVDEVLAGRQEEIKEYVIGTTVYRKHTLYDPRLDSTVRVEAAKLRARLGLYYQRSGRNDPVHISVPKGGYVPQFAAGPAESTALDVSSGGNVPSIVVLPFLNLSADVEADYFADSLVEGITAALAGSNLMRVAPSSAAFYFKGTYPAPGDLQRLLGVDRVLEGSIRKRGDHITVRVQLFDCLESRELWSQTYDKTLLDAAGVHKEIAREVVWLVCGTGACVRRNRSHVPHAEAFDLYVRGRHLVYRWELHAEEQALDTFEQAIAADPEYALPYVGVAEAILCLAAFGVTSPLELIPRAEAAILKALEVDPASAEAHLARATLLARHEWDWVAAEREYRLAIALGPRFAQAHHEYATEFLAPNGRHDEAHTESRRAQELDPFSPAVAYSHPWILIFQRRFLESEQEFRRLLAANAVYDGEHVGLAFALAGQRRFVESLDEYARVVAKDPSPTHACIYAWMHALAGNTRTARRRLSQLETMAMSRYVPAGHLAKVHFALGHTSRGFELLEQAVAHKEPNVRSLKEGFDWDPIRTDTRFSTLLRRLWPQL